MTPQCTYDDQILDFLYGELAGEEQARLQAHLGGCPRCQGLLGGWGDVRKATRPLLGALSESEEQCLERMTQAVLAQLAAADPAAPSGSGGGAEVAGPRPVLPRVEAATRPVVITAEPGKVLPFRRRTALWRHPALGVLAAAAMALIYVVVQRQQDAPVADYHPSAAQGQAPVTAAAPQQKTDEPSLPPAAQAPPPVALGASPAQAPPPPAPGASLAGPEGRGSRGQAPKLVEKAKPKAAAGWWADLGAADDQTRRELSAGLRNKKKGGAAGKAEVTLDGLDLEQPVARARPAVTTARPADPQGAPAASTSAISRGPQAAPAQAVSPALAQLRGLIQKERCDEAQQLLDQLDRDAQQHGAVTPADRAALRRRCPAGEDSVAQGKADTRRAKAQKPAKAAAKAAPIEADTANSLE